MTSIIQTTHSSDPTDNWETKQQLTSNPEASGTGNTTGNATGHDADDDVPKLSFDDMGLPDSLLRGIYGIGFVDPSPVQQRAIQLAKSGRDIIIQAQSGTGKTATFSIATLAQLDPATRAVQAIVLSPTRELATQSQGVLESLGKHVPLHTHASVGGANPQDDRRAMQSGNTHVVCGTPGRVLDNLSKRLLRADAVRVLVLDEADVLLREGFVEQVREIISLLPEAAQIMVVSATLPQEVHEMTSKFLRDPHRVLVKAEQLTLHGISQFYVDCVEAREKASVLEDLYAMFSLQQTVIFCNTRRTVQELAGYLRSKDFPISEIHSEMTQTERFDIMRRFRLGESRLLVATDIIARGIDVQQISMVINYDLPFEREDYIHRIGRSARFGRKGVAINLVVDRDLDKIRTLESFYASEIREMPDPSVIARLLQ